MGFFACTSKFILFFFNLVVVLLSLAVLGIGIYACINGRSYGGQLTTGAITLIVLGSAVTLVAFLGCWGAIQENRCYLHLYASILLILLLILIAIGAWIIIKKDDAQISLAQFIENTFDNAASNDAASLEVVNEIQRDFRCCGTYGPTYWMLKLKGLPASCCYKEQSCTIMNAYSEGCERKVLRYLKEDIKLMGIFAIVVGGIELGGVIFAFILSSSIKRNQLRGHI